MELKQEKYVYIEKEIGETPLEAIEKYRALRPDLANIPMTYAGRLDPMASGTLLILIGDECRNKEKYLGKDKEYEVDILFGIETDTYDALGIPKKGQGVDRKVVTSLDLEKYVCNFVQQYPPYSSKTIDGIQMHKLSRKGELPVDVPVKAVCIKELSLLTIGEIEGDKLLKDILTNIKKVKGDFRQKEISEAWQKLLGGVKEKYPFIRIRVLASSGTYMRSLAHKIGKDIGTGAFALAIKRTKII